MGSILNQSKVHRIGATLNLESAEGWWGDTDCLHQAKSMTFEAENGQRRPIQIIIATDRVAPFVKTTESLIESAKISGILSAKTPEGRPIVRWTYIALPSDQSEIINQEMSKALSPLMEEGVEVTLITSGTNSDSTGISSSRIAVLNFVRNISLDDDPIIAWLDDDLSFSTLIPIEGNPTETFAWSWLHEVWDFHEKNLDVEIGLGDVTGAPPLPASSTISSSLRDLLAHQQNLNISSQDNRWSQFDYYYDISELRTDFSAWPLIHDVDAYSDDQLLHDILVNGSIARPLVATPESIFSPRTDRYVRGGNTVIFNPKWMKEIDHPDIPRRGDTIWALKATKFGANVEHFPIPLHHLRDNLEGDWESRRNSLIQSWSKRIKGDLIGSSVQRWIRAGMVSNASAHEILRHRAHELYDSLLNAHHFSHEFNHQCKDEIQHFIQHGIDAVNDVRYSPDEFDTLLKRMEEYMKN